MLEKGLKRAESSTTCFVGSQNQVLVVLIYSGHGGGINSFYCKGMFPVKVLNHRVGISCCVKGYR